MSTDYSSIKEVNVDGVIKYSRLCPTCGRILYHKGINSAKQQHKKKANCKECSNKVISEKLSGENAPWYGKKIPQESIDKANKTRYEKGFPERKTPEFREKMRKRALENPIMKGKTLYEIWLEKYGEEEANRKMEEYKQSRIGKYVGEKSPCWGKKASKETVEKMRTARIAAGYENSRTPEYREKMRQISTIKEYRNGRSNYEIWLEKYGKEEADRREFEMNEGQRKNTPRGENSPHYGKPPPQGVGRGWQGYYKGVFFRSLAELMLLIELVDNNIEFRSLEEKEFRIPYEYNGEKHTYSGDFLVGNKFIEIKPPEMQKDPKVLIKKEAAEKVCAERGWVFEFRYIKLDDKIIKEKYKNGDIEPIGKFKPKFDHRYGKLKNSTPESQNITNNPPSNPTTPH